MSSLFLKRYFLWFRFLEYYFDNVFSILKYFDILGRDSCFFWWPYKFKAYRWG